jgi:hypothetical protein
MSAKKPMSWVPIGVAAALLLTIAVAWAFRVRLLSSRECAALYAEAATAADSARIDSTVVAPAGFAPAITCGALRGADR